MASMRKGWVGALATLAFSSWPAYYGLGEGDALLATLNKPAVVVATRPSASLAREASPSRARAIISISNYHPADDGTPVEVLVRGHVGNGAEYEVGRFGITPDREFVAAQPADALRFSLPLPSELVTGEPITFSVAIASSYPVNSDRRPLDADGPRGRGAYLRVGEVEIR